MAPTEDEGIFRFAFFLVAGEEGLGRLQPRSTAPPQQNPDPNLVRWEVCILRSERE